MKIQRKFLRDRLRKRVGNKNLQFIWERFQRKKYGEGYEEICRKNQK